MKAPATKTASRSDALWRTVGSTEALLVLTAVIWGCNFVVVKAALRSLDPHLFNALRFSLSVGLLAVYWNHTSAAGAPSLLHRLRTRWHDERALFLRIAALGVGGHVLYQVLFIEGIARTNAGTTSLLLAGVPLWTAVLGRAWGIDRLSGGAWVGLVVGFMGTLLVALRNFDAHATIEGLDIGALLVLLASIAWAVYTLFSKPLMRTLSPISVTLSSMLVGVPILWILAVPSLASTQWTQVGPWTWAGVIYSGALSTGLAYVLWNQGIRARGPSQTAIYGNLVPVVGVATGAIFLNESVGLLEVIGGALILAGLLLMNRFRHTRR